MAASHFRSTYTLSFPASSVANPQERKLRPRDRYVNAIDAS